MKCSSPVLTYVPRRVAAPFDEIDRRHDEERERDDAIQDRGNSILVLDERNERSGAKGKSAPSQDRYQFVGRHGGVLPIGNKRGRRQWWLKPSASPMSPASRIPHSVTPNIGPKSRPRSSRPSCGA